MVAASGQDADLDLSTVSRGGDSWAGRLFLADQEGKEAKAFCGNPSEVPPSGGELLLQSYSTKTLSL